MINWDLKSNFMSPQPDIGCKFHFLRVLSHIPSVRKKGKKEPTFHDFSPMNRRLQGKG